MNDAVTKNRPINVERARRALEENPRFRGRTHLLDLRSNNGVITVRGVLPTYYLRQILINLLNSLEGVDAIVDQIVVEREANTVSPKPR